MSVQHAIWKIGARPTPLVSAALVSADGFLVLGRRSDRVAVNSGMIHPIGGMVEMSESAAPDPFAAVLKELAQEAALPADQTVKVEILEPNGDRRIVSVRPPVKE